ncbi:hypothetical protein ACP275_06G157100 [Erythranthe tilingii]
MLCVVLIIYAFPFADILNRVKNVYLFYLICFFCFCLISICIIRVLFFCRDCGESLAVFFQVLPGYFYVLYMEVEMGFDLLLPLVSFRWICWKMNSLFCYIYPRNFVLFSLCVT